MTDIALALGGGGIKGIAHIGVIRTLEQAGFTIKAVAGTSAGGLIGSIYSAGKSVDEIEDIILHVNQSRLFYRTPDDGPSVMGLGGIIQVLSEHIGNITFSDLKIPFACTAVDTITMQEYILDNGRVIDAVMATIAVPGVFPPKEMNSVVLVDGGVLDPVPVALARWLAPSLPVVAVCLSPAPEGWAHLSEFSMPVSNPFAQPILNQITKTRVAKAFQIFVRSMDITSHMLAELRLQTDKPEVIIRPNVSRFGMLDNVNPKELIDEGVIATEDALDDIQKVMGWTNQITRRFRKVQQPGKQILGDFEESVGK
jgi:NTE family protein